MHYRTVFEQLLHYIPRHTFHSSVMRHEADRNIRKLDTWTWFGALLFGQLTGRESLRSLERPFSLTVERLRSTGMRKVCRSTLAEANQNRPLAVLEETYFRLLRVAQCEVKPHRLKIPHSQILLMDSTVIDLYRNLSPWAEFRRGTSAVKLHTTLSLEGELPGVFVITPALRHDLPVARQYLRFPPGSTLVFDRGYWDVRWLASLTAQGIAFITRQRRNNRFQVTDRRIVDKSTGLLADHTVQQWARRYYPEYPNPLRRISYRDPETKKRLVFLTNRFDLEAKMICDLYKSRWQVELFFKAIKQNLKIRRFLGRSRHAIEAQILVALIAYLLVQISRLKSMTSLSTTVAIETLRGLALYRQPLAQILGPPAPGSGPRKNLAGGAYTK